MRTSTLTIAFATISLALLVAPAGELAPAPTAAAYQCPVSDDPAQDLRCRTACMGDPTNPRDFLEPRMCPA